MGQPRKSAVQVKARERARKLSAELDHRHEQLATLAEEYQAANIESELIVEDAEKKAAAIIAQSRAYARAAQTRAADKARRMLDTGEPAAMVAQRLGLSAAALRKLTTMALDPTTDDHT